MIAGFCATMAMTAAVDMLHRHLHRPNRYPLPPREITQDVLHPGKENAATVTLIAHFGYGALAGALYAFLPRQVPRDLLVVRSIARWSSDRNAAEHR